MPKEKQSVCGRLRSYVIEFGPDTFSIVGNNLFCKICEIRISSEKKFNVSQHISTDKHQKALKRHKDQEQKKKQTLLTSLPTKSTFNADLCEALMAANIPLNKLNNSKFREFLEKYTGKNIPFESTLRKGYVDDVYNKTIENIKTEIGENKIWVSIDETCDVEGRYIANVVVGVLKTDSIGNIFLLHSEQLDRTNHTTICKLFEKAMGILWPGSINYDNVLLFLTDAAPYMIKAGSVLKSFYTKMVHATCVAHGIHRVAEEIRGQFNEVDNLISNVKKFFRKAPSRIQLFKTEAPEIKLPPEPIITRWGTWLDAAIYYCEHYETIVRILNLLDENDAVSIKKAKLCISQPNLQSNLAYIKSNFEVLTVYIKQLQTQYVPLTDSLKVIEDIESKLCNLHGPYGIAVLKKLENVLIKNQGLNSLKQISKIITGGESMNLSSIAEDLTCNDLVFFKYAPITSVDVERSFSAYKCILADNRRAIQFENVRKHLIVQCNHKGKHFINNNKFLVNF